MNLKKNRFSIAGSIAKTVTLTEAGTKKQLPVVRTKDGITFTVAAVKDADILLY